MITKEIKIIAGLIALVIIFAVYIAFRPAALPTEEVPMPGISTTTTAFDVSGTQQQPAQQTPRAPSAQTKQPAPGSMYITSPQIGERLIIGKNLTISWNKESGFKGFVYLADVSTGAVVGWINSEIGPHQTSYIWNTNDLFTARYSPTKKSVGVGRYKIVVGFDSKQAPISSGEIEVIYPSQATIDAYNIIIENFSATPASLTVKKGSALNFTNRDSSSHRIHAASIVFQVAPNETYVFDTNILFPGVHEFYSEQYPTTARISVTVQ